MLQHWFQGMHKKYWKISSVLFHHWAIKDEKKWIVVHFCICWVYLCLLLLWRGFKSAPLSLPQNFLYTRWNTNIHYSITVWPLLARLLVLLQRQCKKELRRSHQLLLIHPHGFTTGDNPILRQSCEWVNREMCQCVRLNFKCMFCSP